MVVVESRKQEDMGVGWPVLKKTCCRRTTVDKGKKHHSPCDGRSAVPRTLGPPEGAEVCTNLELVPRETLKRREVMCKLLQVVAPFELCPRHVAEGKVLVVPHRCSVDGGAVSGSLSESLHCNVLEGVFLPELATSHAHVRLDQGNRGFLLLLAELMPLEPNLRV